MDGEEEREGRSWAGNFLELMKRPIPAAGGEGSYKERPGRT